MGVLGFLPSQGHGNIVNEQQSKPVLDEQTFQKLLEAAFVLQEHRRRVRQVKAGLESQSEKLREEETIQQCLLEKDKPDSEETVRSSPDYTLTLAEIVEAQHQIQTRHLGLDGSLAVVAERIARITRASGSGIGILEGGEVRYLAGTGSPALPVGTEVPLKTAVCQANIRTGQVIRTKDVETEFLYDPESVRQRGIRSLVAVPIHYDGNIVGALELYFDQVEGYADQDIHTCQLMAGLVTEAMGRQSGAAWKEFMAAERTSMLAAIEKLQPKLSAMATAASSTGATEGSVAGRSTADTIVCWKCGNDLARPEQFCGSCGAPQAREASMVSNESQARGASDVSLRSPLAESSIDASLPFTEDEAAALANSLSVSPEVNAEIVSAPSNTEPALQADMVWTSAARTQNFFQSLSAAPTPGALLRFWRSRRGDCYLALAIMLVLGVIGWGIFSNPSVNAKTATTASRNANGAKLTSVSTNLSTFDRLLISLGVAEAPDPPDSKYKGNPDTQVWVDLNTAQYYCPGSDLYEKTANGKLASQHDAELDHFEPAYRKACD